MVEPDEIALKILGAIASDGDRLACFIDLTGLHADRIRQAAQHKDFWVALYDHIASDERLLIEIASEIGEKPEAIMAARHRLSPVEFDM